MAETKKLLLLIKVFLFGFILFALIIINGCLNDCLLYFNH